MLQQEMVAGKTQHLDQVIIAANQSLEDEIAFRKGIEMKLNDMNNQVVRYRNHETTLKAKIDDILLSTQLNIVKNNDNLLTIPKKNVNIFCLFFLIFDNRNNSPSFIRSLVQTPSLFLLMGCSFVNYFVGFRRIWIFIRRFPSSCLCRSASGHVTQ